MHIPSRMDDHDSPVRVARRRAGLDQEQLAERSGVPQGTISRIERGQTPNSGHALRLARALGSTVEELFGHIVDADAVVDPDAAPATDATRAA
jgi:transcriptional regulator with XRE-family HTH domain